MDWKYASEDHNQLVEETLDRLRERADQRRVLLKPVFQDFDRHNNGHITRQQFRQVIVVRYGAVHLIQTRGNLPNLF